MKKHFNCLFLFVLIFIFNSCSNTKYVKFRVVKFDMEKEDFYYENEYSKEYERNFTKVLDFFEQDYIYKNGILYINKELADDEEYLCNLCAKATDSWVEYHSPEWIRSHAIISE